MPRSPSPLLSVFETHPTHDDTADGTRDREEGFESLRELQISKDPM